MANINYSLLTSCRLVRDRVLLTIDEQAAIALLDKVKKIEFTRLVENYFVGLEQIAGYYDLDLQSLRQIVELAKYRQELQENGVNFMYDRSSNQRVLLINGQAILRLALILSDRSLIALSIRNLLVSRQYSISSTKTTVELVQEIRPQSISPLCA